MISPGLVLVVAILWLAFLLGVIWPLLWAFGRLEQQERPEPPERQV